MSVKLTTLSVIITSLCEDVNFAPYLVHIRSQSLSKIFINISFAFLKTLHIIKSMSKKLNILLTQAILPKKAS
jgi:hypothetical protein